MLTGLQIKNYTIVDELQIDFEAGLTVVTGETGAGKSIIIDALELALGARAAADAIRHGQDRCDISAIFDLKHNAAARDWLAQHDLEAHDECILRRSLTSEGRSRSFINGQPTTTQTTREFSQLLVDIHGQHEHQALFKHDTHRLQLDEFAKHAKLLELTAAKFKQWQQLKHQLTSLTALEQHDAQCQLLRYQVEELAEANLLPAEIDTLLAEHQLLNQAENMLNQCHTMLELLASESQRGILNHLNQCQRLFTEFKSLNPALINAQELIATALINCEEARTEISHFVTVTEPNPTRLAELEQRLQQLNNLARKHKVSLKDLASLQTQLQQQLNDLEQHQQLASQLTQQLHIAEQDYDTVATQLSHSRRAAATKLSAAITTQIRQLGMPNAAIEVQITSDQQIRQTGIDKIEYYIMTNPGQPAKPLAKIVSGGELSRISLAIEVITSQQHHCTTLLFDEVDVGIGGSTAAIVGKLLRLLGESAQVICVTHQPQVAAQSHHHYNVHKINRNNNTFSQIKLLNHEAKIQEIARMLGGLEITTQTLAHAAELLEYQA